MNYGCGGYMNHGGRKRGVGQGGYFKYWKNTGEEINNVATLALGLQPSQGLTKVQAKRKAQESHLMLLGV